MQWIGKPKHGKAVLIIYRGVKGRFKLESRPVEYFTRGYSFVHAVY